MTHNLQKFQLFWQKYEPYIFMVIVLCNLLPVLGVPVFFTGDGPSHLYNSNIIGSLQTVTNSAYLPFFELREILIPNLGGHTLLTFFNLFMPAIWAEKVLSVLYLISLPWAFRYAVKSWSGAVHPFVFLVFPLAHNFCFYIGFQSFVLSLALLFVCVGYAKKVLATGRWMQFLWLSFLLFLTAYFHLFAAVVAFIILGFYALFLVFKKQISVQRFFIFALAALPSALFCGSFVLANGGGFQWNNVPVFDQLRIIYNALPIVTIDGNETVYSVPFVVSLLLAMLLVFWQKPRSKSAVVFAVSGALMLGLFFVLPDKMASGGFVSFRLLLCAFLLFAFWVAADAKFTKATLVLAGLVLLINLVKLPYQWGKAKELSRDAETFLLAEKHLQPGETAVVLNYSLHWMHYNIGLYLGAERDIIVLDNYEADKTHFPVKWKTGMQPHDLLGDFAFSNLPTLKVLPYEEKTGKAVDAVVRWKHSTEMQDAATKITDSVLQRYFYPAISEAKGDVEIYLRRK